MGRLGCLFRFFQFPGFLDFTLFCGPKHGSGSQLLKLVARPVAVLGVLSSRVCSSFAPWLGERCPVSPEFSECFFSRRFSAVFCKKYFPLHTMQRAHPPLQRGLQCLLLLQCQAKTISSLGTDISESLLRLWKKDSHCSTTPPRAQCAAAIRLLPR